MFGIADYGAFVAAIVLFLLIPGPGNLALITSTSKGGIRGGLAATTGVIIGDQCLMWAAVAGVSAVLAAYPAAFKAVQWLGAAYLAWLGLKMLLAKPGSAPILNIKPSHFLRQAFTITLLNPKAIVFYMAFFPLFVDPARHQGLVTFGAMAVTIAALTFLYGLTSTLLTHFLAERIRANPRISATLEKLAGTFLIAFGVKLAISRGSNITRSRPMICRFLLRLACTCLMVLTRSVSPSSAKYSHCIGTITPWAAHRPFSVNRLRLGGQSISTKSYSAPTAASAVRRRFSRRSSATISTSAPASSRLAPSTS
jgi:threonine/homoserine/homoserine lactone efflux protein